MRRPKWYVPPLDRPRRTGCFNCPPKPVSLRMSTPLCVGFGVVWVTRDGEGLWQGDDEHVWIRRFENRAAADPKHDWRVHFDSPLSSQVYQRHGEKEWNLIETGDGFA